MSDNEPKVESKQPEEETKKKTKKPRKCCVCKKKNINEYEM